MYQSQERSRMLSIATIICVLCSIHGSHTLSFSGDLQCNFLDSINITDGQHLEDGTILFEDIAYKPHQYAKVNYIWVNGKEKQSVKEHTRGCICEIKSCVRMCCPHGQVVDMTIKSGRKCRSHESANTYKHSIENESNQIQEVALEKYFHIVDERPCRNFFETENYTMKHTGEVFVHSAEEMVHHHKYCIKTELNDTTNTTEMSLLMCIDKDKQTSVRFAILPYGMLLSLPFIVATFLVYFCIPELYNLHGKCLLSYLFALAVGYAVMATVQLNGSKYVEPILCKTMGYLIYFSFVAAFLWLSVISFDLWFGFCTTNALRSIGERGRFGLYMIYAWGLSSVLTLMAFVLDSTETLSSKLKPGIGVETCFLKRDVFTGALFFYMPLGVIISINIVFYVLTALKIRQGQRQMGKFTSNSESSTNQKSLNSKNAHFALYLRLFIVMGVTWSMEAISFFISSEGMQFLVTDICNSVQGVIIFALFVLKRRVFRQINKRWKQITGKPNDSNESTLTRTSNLHLNLIERNDIPNSDKVNSFGIPQTKKK